MEQKMIYLVAFTALLPSFWSNEPEATESGKSIVIAKREWAACVRFSPDGKWLAWSSGTLEDDNWAKRVSQVKFWDVKKQKRGPQRSTFKGYVGEFAFSPDGKLAVPVIDSWFGSGRLCLIDPDSGRETKSIAEKDGKANLITFSPDGKILAGLRHRSITLWDSSTLREVSLLPTKTLVDTIAFTPDNKTLMVDASGLGLEKIDTVTGKSTVTEIEAAKERGAFATAFSRDGKLIATGHGKDTLGKKFDSPQKRFDFQLQEGEVRITDIETGKQVAELKGHKKMVRVLAFSEKGDLLASGDDGGGIKIFDVPTGKEIANLAGHSDWISGIRSLCFSHDGQLLASCAGDGYVRVWKLGK
jgi:WD40 repeat protein